MKTMYRKRPVAFSVSLGVFVGISLFLGFTASWPLWSHHPAWRDGLAVLALLAIPATYALRTWPPTCCALE
jgi:peptidoglycan/LPS O-acetylase OafA/YrhL